MLKGQTLYRPAAAMVHKQRFHGGHAAGTTASVKATFRLLLKEAQRLVWQILLLGSGLWLACTASIDGFVVGLARSFEETKPRIEDGPVDRSFVRIVREGIVRIARRAQSKSGAWREHAMSVDASLLSRRGLGD